MDTAAPGIESEGDLAALIGTIEAAPAGAPLLAARALEVVRHGVITGEGPTSAGRIHFSRAIDSTDTEWVRRILVAGGRGAVTRAEADALFDIHEAAMERMDGGAFDCLLAKAVAHHVLSTCHHRVPDRATALAATTPLADWATDAALDRDVAAWLAARLRRRPGNQARLAPLAALLGPAECPPAPALAFDLAA